VTSKAVKSAALCAFVISVPQLALAADTTINTAQTTTQGPTTPELNGGDTLTIGPAGSVTVTGTNTLTNTLGISGTGSSNTITNSGSITTLGDYYADGIYTTGDSTIITTSGSISTSGQDSYGIYGPGGSFNTITNSGSISTTGQGGVGIGFVGGSNNTITNSGSVRVAGNDASGIFGTGTGNTVNNYGTITTSGSVVTTGSDVSGIYITGDSATINNYGTIETTGNGLSPGGNASGINVVGSSGIIVNSGTINAYGSVNARGIRALGSNNTITNSGTITTRNSTGIVVQGVSNSVINTGAVRALGNGDTGISLSGASNTLENTGSIISYSGSSVIFVGSGNTLDLGNGSFIAGNINLGTGTQINITTGANFSKLINYTGTLSGISASGSVPAFINTSTNQVAIYDPTLFAASSDALGDMTSTISSLTPGRFNGSDKDHPLWVRGFGMAASYEGTDATLDRSYNYSGVAIGYDFKRSKDLSLGVLGGYGQTSLWANAESTQSFNTNSDDGFLGLYGQKRWKNVAVDFALYGGLQSFQQQRYVNDNLAYLGNSSANASYQGWWIAPEAGITYNAGEVNGWSFLPTARLRYAQQWMGGYTETGGGSANATVNGRNVAIGQSFVGIGTRKTMKTLMGKDTKMVLDGQVGYIYRGVVGDDSVNVTMIGQSQSLATESSSRNAVAVSAGVTLDLSSAVALKIRGDFAAGGGMQYGSGGWAGLSVKF